MDPKEQLPPDSTETSYLERLFFRLTGLFKAPAFYASCFLLLGGVLVALRGFKTGGWTDSGVLYGSFAIAAGSAGVLTVVLYPILLLCVCLTVLKTLRILGDVIDLEYRNYKRQIIGRCFQLLLNSSAEELQVLAQNAEFAKLPPANIEDSSEKAAAADDDTKETS